MYFEGPAVGVVALCCFYYYPLGCELLKAGREHWLEYNVVVGGVALYFHFGWVGYDVVTSTCLLYSEGGTGTSACNGYAYFAWAFGCVGLGGECYLALAYLKGAAVTSVFGLYGGTRGSGEVGGELYHFGATLWVNCTSAEASLMKEGSVVLRPCLCNQKPVAEGVATGGVWGTYSYYALLEKVVGKKEGELPRLMLDNPPSHILNTKNDCSKRASSGAPGLCRS